MKLRVADREIDLKAHEIRQGGEPVHVEPQVFDLVALLARNPGRLVSRDEIIQEVWSGRIVSDSTVDARVAAARRALGDDGRRQVVIATVPRRGLRMVAPVETVGGEPGPVAPRPAPPPRQSIRFATSTDGTRIAWASTGDGPPLLRAGVFLGHLEHDWRSILWNPLYAELSAALRLIRYDQRGAGLSQRDPPAYDLDRQVNDLEAVADAAGLDRFALWGASQGAAIAVAFAARRPERICRLILQGGFVQGRMVRDDPDERARAKTVVSMIREGWGHPEGPFLQAFSTLYMPDGTPEQLTSMVEIQRAAATPEGAVRIREAVDLWDVTGLLAKIDAPTLVIHCTDDGVQPFSEGRLIAETIPGAELLPIESRNHVMLPQDPNWACIDAIIDFTLAGEV